MKKIIALSLAIIMMLSFVGCQTTKITRGSIEGDVYKNDFFGLEFTKPASWVYSTDEEIAAALNMGADLLLDDDLKDALERNSSIYDMMVKDSKTGTNISVGYENLAKSFASNITVEQYIDALEEQFASVTTMNVTFPDKYDTVKLGQTEFTRVVCDTTVPGVSGSMEQVYYLSKKDGYMGFIIVTIVSGYTVEDIEAMFK